MKKLLLILSLYFSSFVWAGEEHTALDAANNWLNIVDAGEYAKSWQKSDPFFKSQISQSKWNKAVKNVRRPLGKVNSRLELSRKGHSTLPGVPDGEYLVIQYQTEFQHKKSATEILTLSKSSGYWRTVGYFIK